ncbi:MAG: dihydrofolate reductase [Treponema sp.]|nr:dihydrofolate reductase [Treponema sp.]
MIGGQEIILIAAMADNRVIGKNNSMPFSVKGNLARFKEMTMGWPCIMGRKTWQSLPKKPLPGRLNIIISRSVNDYEQDRSGEPKVRGLVSARENNQDSIKFFDSLSKAIDYCEDFAKIFICGGESIYKQSLDFANKIDLTIVAGRYEGDAFFPEIGDNWKKKDTVSYENFSVVTYIK